MADGAPDAGQGIAVLGGTFNPLHVGHLRLAIEVHEAFAGMVSRVDILPNSRPPHKANAAILPFAIRAALIREACTPYPWLSCNELEGEREDQSYTWDTLGIFAEREPGRRIYFVLGSGDFEMLPSWKNGLRLPERCTPVVVPRGFYPLERFQATVRRFWPGAEPSAAAVPGASGMRTPQGEMLFLPVPWLDVSSSAVRERCAQGRSLDFLVPAGVARLLESRRADLARHWLGGRKAPGA
ncbi:MAG: nicotinate (nicotinamide) nucleotide adenylyltransferase [Desulfovibrio sp.]|nr:nicotinate (nicotinamide) nucleotide adenylyltransferase [Desulfovibrio sp.]